MIIKIGKLVYFILKNLKHTGRFKMDFTEKTIEKNYVFKGKILSVRSDDVLLFNGERAKREIVEHSGGAAVLCVQEGKALLVRQFRYAYKEEVLEIPAGKLEKGEDPKQAAMRELLEEGGIVAERIEPMLVLYPSPGYTNEKIHIYFCSVGKKTAQHLDEGEFLSAEWIALEELKILLREGKIQDAKTVAALQAYFLRETK